jgi:hypothetical protein
MTLKIEISGTGPAKYEPVRKSLHLFPIEFERDFYVLPMPDDDHVDRKAKSWHFVFRLKPKHDKITAIDGIKLVTYDPDHPGKIKFVSHFADPIAVKVAPKRTETEFELEALAAPERIYSVADADEILAQDSTWRIAPWQIVLVLGLPPALCLAGVGVYRARCPGAARRARRIRNAAARRAVDQLHSAPADVWGVVCRYLQERFDFASPDPTPVEVAAFLKRHGFAKATREHARSFFQNCDASRFAKSEPATSLAQDAIRLIEALEADRCA